MTNSIDFWNASTRWENDCRREIKKRRFRPDLWEPCQDGSIIRIKEPFRRVENVVTPWRESKHYVELDVEEMLENSGGSQGVNNWQKWDSKIS